MFCYQCEQTSKGTGCQQIGVCGKEPETAALQDLLVHATKGLSMYAHRAAQLGVRDAAGRSGHARRPVRHGDQRRFRPGPHRRAPGPGRGGPRQGPRTLRGGLCQGGQDAGETLRPRRLAAGRRPRGPGPAGRRGGRPQVPGDPRNRHCRPAGTDALRTERGRGLRRSRPGAGLRRRRPVCPIPRGPRFPRRAADQRRRHPGLGLEGRRIELEGHGTARQGQHGDLWPSRADRGECSARSRARRFSSPATT